MRLVTAILVVMLVAGCASKHVAETRSAATTPTKASTETAKKSPILYQRTGGIAGTDDRVVIWPDGLVTVRGKLMGTGSVRLNEADVAKVQDLFADFDALRAEYSGGAPDAYEITIRYGAKTVTASDLAPDLPESFRKIFTAIEGVAAQVTANPAP